MCSRSDEYPTREETAWAKSDQKNNTCFELGVVVGTLSSVTSDLRCLQRAGNVQVLKGMSKNYIYICNKVKDIVQDIAFLGPKI